MRYRDQRPVENPHSEYYYIYVILNLDTGKRYVGCSKNVEKRMEGHRTSLKYRKHTAINLQEDYDNGMFEHYEVEIVEKSICSLEAHALEMAYMIIYKTYDERYGYNSRDYRFWSNRGKHESGLRRLLRERDEES